ncbi:hypothetical protein ACPCTK_25930 [Streptomyces pseudogriseolus]|uniref:SbtR family transcriptional regulator n=1 Tax=Streptomyces pseudogriseolus TaxID=36817 RepID=UPI003FA1E6F9
MQAQVRCGEVGRYASPCEQPGRASSPQLPGTAPRRRPGQHFPLRNDAGDTHPSYVATKRAISDELNRDSEMFRASRVAMYEAGEPLFTRAQEAGEARRDASFDNVLRMITGIIATGYVSDEQRGRILRFALDGIRTGKD